MYGRHVRLIQQLDMFDSELSPSEEQFFFEKLSEELITKKKQRAIAEKLVSLIQGL
jgi:hypothetical protein